MTDVQSVDPTLPSSGNDAAPGFGALDLPEQLVSALARQEITRPTPVQATALDGCSVRAR